LLEIEYHYFLLDAAVERAKKNNPFYQRFVNQGILQDYYEINIDKVYPFRWDYEY
jgi:hypothetical protein